MKADKKLDPEKGKLKITLPLPPNMANARIHWRGKHRERVAYLNACDMAVLLQSPDLFPGWTAPDMTRVRATVYCGALHDEDNLLARMKFALDWMVSRAYLKGDSPKYLSWDWPLKQVVKRGQEYRVEFELEAA